MNPIAQPAAPATEDPPAPAALTAARQLWPNILEAVRARRRFAWILLSQNAHIAGFDGRTLQLGFCHAGGRDSFVNGGSDAVLQEVLAERFGVHWNIESIIDSHTETTAGPGAPAFRPARRATSSAPLPPPLPIGSSSTLSAEAEAEAEVEEPPRRPAAAAGAGTDAAVTIKVINVNGRRMTRNIYRQLPSQSLLSDDGTMEGTPWGRIVDPRCCHSSTHWHVLYERDGQLFVWTVPQHLEHADPHLRPGAYRVPTAVGTPFLDACVLETHLGSTEFFEGRIFDGLQEGRELTTTVETLRVHLECSVPAARFAQATTHAPNSHGLAEAEKALKAVCDLRGSTARALYDALIEDVRRVKQARANYRFALETAGELPQLFIGS